MVLEYYVRTMVPWYYVPMVRTVRTDGTTPGLAAEAYAAIKAAKYAAQDNFIPFILETRRRVNKAARDWLDALTAPEPGEKCPARTTTRGTRRRGRPLRPS